MRWIAWCYIRGVDVPDKSKIEASDFCESVDDSVSVRLREAAVDLDSVWKLDHSREITAGTEVRLDRILQSKSMLMYEQNHADSDIAHGAAHTQHSSSAAKAISPTLRPAIAPLVETAYIEQMSYGTNDNMYSGEFTRVDLDRQNPIPQMRPDQMRCASLELPCT